MPEERKYSREEVTEIAETYRLRDEVTETLLQHSESCDNPVFYERVARLRQACDKYPEFFGYLKIRLGDAGTHLDELIETEQWREDAAISLEEKPEEGKEGSDDDEIPF